MVTQALFFLQVIVPSDISELLTKGHQLTPAMFDLAPPTARPYSEVQHEFRMLILSGRKKVCCVGGAGGCVPVMLDMLGKLVLDL